MHGQGRYHEEESLGKIYDIRLFKRILAYMKPYRWYAITSIALLMFVATLDLSLPFLTKIVIDSYIIPNTRLIRYQGDTTDLKIHNLGHLDRFAEGIYIIDSKYLDAGEIVLLEKAEVLEKERYYHIDPARYEDSQFAEIESIIKGNVAYLGGEGGAMLVSQGELKKLTPLQLLKIRRYDLKMVLMFGLLYLIFMAINFVFGYFQVYLLTFVGQKSMYDIRRQTFNHIQRMPLSFFDKTPTGRLVTRTTNDINALSETFSSVIINFFKQFFFIIGIVIVMLVMNWRLALIGFSVIPLLILLTVFMRTALRKTYRMVRVKLARINATLSEHISGIRVTQLFRRERQNSKLFSDINQDYFRANIKQLVTESSFWPMVQVIDSFGIALIIYFGGGKVIQNSLTIGELTAFLSYIQMFFRPIRELSEQYNLLQAAMAASERIFEILDRKVESEGEGDLKTIDQLKGEVEFKDVWFAYNQDEWVLKGISFHAKPGESVALVGATGAGKSTIINLLGRFYDVQKGSILIDGRDINSLDRYMLRRNIAIVMQDVFLFSGDIKNNISLGDESIGLDRIEQVSRYVNADKFIQRLPAKYDEPVTERGSTLSMGQRQLLAFARALAFDPKILVLDEATANIDTETELLIQDALAKLMKGRTSIIIAHRLSTIQRVDKIIVIKDGAIVEMGSHNELLKKQGAYWRLYQLQYQPQS